MRGNPCFARNGHPEQVVISALFALPALLAPFFIVIFGALARPVVVMNAFLQQKAILELVPLLKPVGAFSRELLDGNIGRETVISKTIRTSAIQTVKETEMVGFRVEQGLEHTLVQAFVHSKQHRRFYLVSICATTDCSLVDSDWKCVCSKGKQRDGVCCSHVLALALMSYTIGRYRRGVKCPHWMSVSHTFPKSKIPYMVHVPRYVFLASATYLERLYVVTLSPNCDALEGHFPGEQFVFGRSNKAVTSSWRTAEKHFFPSVACALRGTCPECASLPGADAAPSLPESGATRWSAMTVAQLKQVLRQRGLPLSGGKQDLVERLVTHTMASHPSAEGTSATACKRPHPVDAVEDTSKRSRPNASAVWCVGGCKRSARKGFAEICDCCGVVGVCEKCQSRRTLELFRDAHVRECTK